MATDTNASCSTGSTLSDSAKLKAHAAEEKESQSSVSSTPNTTTLHRHIMIFGASIKKDVIDICTGKEGAWEEDDFYLVKTTSVVQANDDNDHGGERKTPHQYIDFFTSDNSDETEANQEPGPEIKKTKTAMVGPDPDPGYSPLLDLELSIGRGNWEQPAAPAEDLWTIKKVLKKSDIDSSSRLLLGKVFVQEHILPHVMGNWLALNDGGGFEVNIRDVDTGSEHMLVLKLWRSSNSFVLTKNWMSEFVKRRELEENDEIGFRWDDQNSRLEFTLLRKN